MPTQVPSTPNAPPGAVDDLFYVPRCSDGDQLGVLTNDTDPDGDPLTLESITPAQYGTATIVGGLYILYVPFGASGVWETINYTARDSRGGTTGAQLRIYINESNCGGGGGGGIELRKPGN